MAFRLYVVPKIGAGTRADPYRAKYFQGSDKIVSSVGDAASSTDPTQVTSVMDYGFEPWMFVGANLAFSDDTLVVGEPDAYAIPFDLSQLPTSAQVTNVQAKLEAMNVPSGWVTTALTWLQIVRVILWVFGFVQLFGSIYADQNNGALPPVIFGGGRSLGTTYGALPLAMRTALASTAVTYGVDISSVTGATTLRQILQLVANGKSTQQFNFNGVQI